MLLALLFPFLSLAADCVDPRVDKTLGFVHAHRGTGHGPGENTLAAFRKAAELGAEVLELDLQVTRDNQLVIHHDGAVGAHCSRLTDDLLPTREIGELTLEQLRAFRCGPAEAKGPEHGIATLHELLAAFKGGKARFNIEMKANAKVKQKPLAFARLVLAELRRAEVLERAIVQSFELDYLEAVRGELAAEEKAKLQRSLLLGWAGWTSNWVKLAQKYELQMLSPSVEKLRFGRGTLESLHAAGVKVVPYTPDTEELWVKYLKLGVDGLITNKPAELIAFLKGNKRYSCLLSAP